MKVKVEAHLKPWVAPDRVYFDEGLKLPLGAVPKEFIETLCIAWLDAVTAKVGLEYQISFRDTEHEDTQ